VELDVLVAELEQRLSVALLDRAECAQYDLCIALH
jgi:hypothetical protein